MRRSLFRNDVARVQDPRRPRPALLAPLCRRRSARHYDALQMANRLRRHLPAPRQPALLSLHYRSPLCRPRPTDTGSRCSSATAIRCARHGRLTIGLLVRCHRSPLCRPRPTAIGLMFRYHRNPLCPPRPIDNGCSYCSRATNGFSSSQPQLANRVFCTMVTLLP